MADYDALVVGAGIAGLVAGAILAKEGKKVAVLERDHHLGGRAGVFYHDGYKLGFGAHLCEDTGSGTAKIMTHLGKPFEVGPQNDNMPVYHQGKWQPMAEVIGADKGELKKVIKALIETPYEDFDKWEDVPLRNWIQQYTNSEGVIAQFEFVSMVEGATMNWWDHSAAENLYIRKLHYTERRTAGFSFWPKKGWDGYFEDVADVIRSNGGELQLGRRVRRIVIENGQVRGVTVEDGQKATPNEYLPRTLVEAPAVICTVPVWNVLEILPTDQIPEWYVDKIKMVSADTHRATYLGFYIATEEPFYTVSPRELAAWFKGPVTGYPGWGFSNSALDETVAPPGKHLWVCGVYVPPAKVTSEAFLDKTFADIEEELGIMLPATRTALWKRRHLVYKPTYCANKPGIMGPNRPGAEIPGVAGLYFSGDSYQGRFIGTDRAARQGLAAAQRVLGYNISGLEEVTRY